MLKLIKINDEKELKYNVWYLCVKPAYIEVYRFDGRDLVRYSSLHDFADFEKFSEVYEIVKSDDVVAPKKQRFVLTQNNSMIRRTKKLSTWDSFSDTY